MKNHEKTSASRIELTIYASEQVFEDYHISIAKDTAFLSNNQGSIVFKKETIRAGDQFKKNQRPEEVLIVGELYTTPSVNKKTGKHRHNSLKTPFVIRIDYY